MQDFKTQKIKEAIKDLLKKKGLTYEDLSAQLECSVPTIKRILGPEELSLTRLFQLCEILDISLSDLETMTKTQGDKDEVFTPEQEAFLAKNKNYFAYLMQLFSGESPKQIAEKHKLTDRATDKYLIGLEKQELIRVTGKQKVKPAFKSLPHLGMGVLSRAYFESLISSSARYFISVISAGLRNEKFSETGETAKFSFSGLSVTKASYLAYTAERNRAFNEFEKLAAFEEKTMDPSELMVAVILEANSLVNKGHKDIQIIENAMGEIVNI
jgi:transcriptional regulator with XRE-family HTH domain